MDLDDFLKVEHHLFFGVNRRRFFLLSVFGSLSLADKLPAGSSYLPPTAASTGYGAPSGQPSYGGGNDDYYDDLDSYGDNQVKFTFPRLLPRSSGRILVR